MQGAELCLNIWFVVDIATGHSYNWMGRVYNLMGNDDDKTVTLKKLAETDYQVAERESFPNEWKVVVGNRTFEGHITSNQINSIIDLNLEFFINKLEKNLPKLISFTQSDQSYGTAEPQKIPDNPLFVLTILMENEKGELIPNTSTENKALIEKERIRISNLK